MIIQRRFAPTSGHFEPESVASLTGISRSSLQALKERILRFQQYYEEIVKPFEWKFTRKDLHRLMSKIKIPWTDSYQLAA